MQIKNLSHAFWILPLIWMTAAKIPSCKFVKPVHGAPLPQLVKPGWRIPWEDAVLQGIKRFEGYAAAAYNCPAGVRTIGYGHTGKHAQHGKISQQLASKLLQDELDRIGRSVDRIVAVSLTAHQRAALVSFTYNCGEGNLRRLVSGRGRLNDGHYDSVPRLLMQYTKANGKPLRGLERRRAWESELWNGIYNLAAN